MELDTPNMTTQAPTPQNEAFEEFMNTFKKHVINMSRHNIIDEINELGMLIFYITHSFTRILILWIE